MRKITNLFLNNTKKMMIIGFIITVVCYIYCAPVEPSKIIEYIGKSLFVSLALLLMIHGAKLNNSTGATKLFSKLIFYKYTECIVTYGILIIAIIGVFRLFYTHDFIDSVLLIPSLIGCYSSSRATEIYESELVNQDKEI